MEQTIKILLAEEDLACISCNLCGYEGTTDNNNLIVEEGDDKPGPAEKLSVSS